MRRIRRIGIHAHRHGVARAVAACGYSHAVAAIEAGGRAELDGARIPHEDARVERAYRYRVSSAYERNDVVVAEGVCGIVGEAETGDDGGRAREGEDGVVGDVRSARTRVPLRALRHGAEGSERRRECFINRIPMILLPDKAVLREGKRAALLRRVQVPFDFLKSVTLGVELCGIGLRRVDAIFRRVAFEPLERSGPAHFSVVHIRDDAAVGVSEIGNKAPLLGFARRIEMLFRPRLEELVERREVGCCTRERA